MRSFSFNRPLTLLFTVPLLVMAIMFTWGLTVEFRISILFMLLLTGGLFLLLLYYSLFRRLRIHEGKAFWITPLQRLEIPLADLRHFGIVKFRRFRFIYLSRAEALPFQDPSSPVVSDQDTFLIQYRPGAWDFLSKWIKGLHPTLKPESFSRQ